MEYGMFDGMDGFDALAGAVQAVVPLGIGTGITFATAEAIDFLVKNPSVRKWRWAAAGGLGFAAGLVMWKLRSPEEGALTLGSAILTALVGFGVTKLNEKRATMAGLRGLRAYQLTPAQPLLAGNPMAAYQLNPAEPLFAGFPGAPSGETVQMQAVNPGVFGY
jgi:hypothetical protein